MSANTSAQASFQTQMFFLLSRYRQLLGLGQLDLFSGRYVADYLFAKDRIFANINLDDEDLRLYEHVAEVLEERVPRPDLVVYLQASTEVLMRRIDWRGRSYERDMDAAYIQTLVGLRVDVEEVHTASLQGVELLDLDEAIVAPDDRRHRDR